MTSENCVWCTRSRFLDVDDSVFSRLLRVSAADEGSEDGIERTCDTLLMCIVTVLNQGLRNGGGVGDVLRRPSKDVSKTDVFNFLPSFPLSLPSCLSFLPHSLTPSTLSFFPELGIEPINMTYPRTSFHFL